MPDPREDYPGWLDALAADRPDPGGGAAGALILGIAAALASMVAGYTTTGRGLSAESEAAAARIRERSEVLRAMSYEFSQDDAAASFAFAAAYRMPDGSSAERADKARAILAASVDAGRNAARLGAAASPLIPDLRELAEKGNPIVLADVAVGAAALGAALETAAINARVDLASAVHARADLDAHSFAAGGVVGDVDVERGLDELRGALATLSAARSEAARLLAEILPRLDA